MIRIATDRAGIRRAWVACLSLILLATVLQLSSMAIDRMNTTVPTKVLSGDNLPAMTADDWLDWARAEASKHDAATMRAITSGGGASRNAAATAVSAAAATDGRDGLAQ